MYAPTVGRYAKVNDREGAWASAPLWQVSGHIAGRRRRAEPGEASPSKRVWLGRYFRAWRRGRGGRRSLLTGPTSAGIETALGATRAPSLPANGTRAVLDHHGSGSIQLRTRLSGTGRKLTYRPSLNIPEIASQDATFRLKSHSSGAIPPLAGSPSFPIPRSPRSTPRLGPLVISGLL